MTGFSALVRLEIAERSGLRCEVGAPGCTIQPTEFHHRRPRGAGGSKRPDTNLACNGLAVCRTCHARIESQREWALRLGYLLRQTDNPEAVSVGVERP